MRLHALVLNLFLTTASAIEVQFYHYNCCYWSSPPWLRWSGDSKWRFWVERRRGPWPGPLEQERMSDFSRAVGRPPRWENQCRSKVQLTKAKTRLYSVGWNAKLKGIAKNNCRRAFSPCESSPSRMGRCWFQVESNLVFSFFYPVLPF